MVARNVMTSKGAFVLITRLLRTAAVVLSTSALLTACASPQPAAAPAPSGASTATESAPAAPKVSRLVFAMTAPAFETNDIRHLGTPDEWHMDPQYESMIAVDPNTGKYIGLLASEWSLDLKNNDMRYKLRKGVQFHKGYGEFTAKDVVVKMREKVRDEPAAKRSSISAFWTGILKDVEVVNDYEVVYHLKQPSGLVVDYASDQQGGASIWSGAHFEKIGVPDFTMESLAGTAPYQYDSRAQGQYIRFTKVSYKHWRVDAEFPAFEFRFVKEASTRLAGLLAGEIHMTDIPNDLAKQAEAQGFKSVQGKVPALRAFVSFMCCQWKNPKDVSQGYIDLTSPLQDVRVRKALSKAINYDELNKGLFGGKGERMVNNPLHPVRPGWDPAWEKRWPDEYGYDTTAAKALLAQAGYTTASPLKVNFAVRPVNGVAGAEDVADTLGGYWRAIGVDVNLHTVDAVQYSANSIALQVQNDIAIASTSSNAWTGVFNYGSSLLHRSMGPEQPEVDVLMDKIRNTMDIEAQTPLWHDIGEALFTAHHFIPLFWVPTTAVVNPKIVAGYVFPGSISGSWTHVENIKAAK